ncbi:MAG: efflux RND transporter periplasmic adaptor subunit [Pirellula sp.]|nr:efflux RND transporter periplasmic adaptor subunit [Pirellula sp.]
MSEANDTNSTLEAADQLLSRIERMAESNADSTLVWSQILDALRLLTRCKAVALAVPFGMVWRVVQSNGESNTNAVLNEYLAKKAPFDFTGDLIEFAEGVLLGTFPVGPQDNPSGVLLLCFAANTPKSAGTHAKVLAEAFAEIGYVSVTKQQMVKAQERISNLNSIVLQIGNTNTFRDLDQVIVDALQGLLKAERVSLVSFSSKAIVLASSNSMHIDRSSPTVKAIEAFASAVSADTESKGESDSGTKLLADRTCLDYPGGRKSLRIVVEWASPLAMQEQLSLMSYWSGLFASSLRQQERVLGLPRWIRKLDGSISSWPNWATKAFKLASAGVAVIALGYAAVLPLPMKIQADATLEPVSQRSIFATADGTIERILVSDGEQVIAGQVLAVMHSPGLDLMAEEALGKLRAMAEKRNGLMVAINQATLDANSEATQTNITSELLVLDAQEKHTRSMLEFVRSQQKELELKSPIDGVVVASEIKRELDQRPLKRGDSLFKVVQLDDQWHLQIKVADRDSYWIRRFYNTDSNEQNAGSSDLSMAPNRVRVQFDSLPDKQFDAFITRVEKFSENHLGQGSFQFVTASIDAEVAKEFHMGSVATVTFLCGNESAWYVWCRPLVEFVQTRTGWLTRVARVGE